MTASGNVDMNSETGTIDIDQAVTSQAGNVSASAKKNLTIGADVVAKNNVALLSKNAAISVNDSVTSQDGDIIATAKENITIGAGITAFAGNVKAIAGTGATDGTGATATNGNIEVSGDITVGANKDVLLETKQGDIYVGTFTDDGQTAASEPQMAIRRALSRLKPERVLSTSLSPLLPLTLM